MASAMNTALARMSVMRFLFLFRPPIAQVLALADRAALAAVLAGFHLVATAAELEAGHLIVSHVDVRHAVNFYSVSDF